MYNLIINTEYKYWILNYCSKEIMSDQDFINKLVALNDKYILLYLLEHNYILINSIDNCDNKACVQCQRTKYVDFRFPK